MEEFKLLRRVTISCPLSYPRPVACKSVVVSDSKIAAFCDSLRQSIT